MSSATVKWNFCAKNGARMFRLHAFQADPDPDFTLQGGSDKSGFFFFLLLNEPTQLKNIRFY
jgi:hypothetical protein